MSMRRWTWVAGVIAAMLAVPSAALAQSALTGDEVALKNSGMIRGTVVSMEPGKEVVILIQGTVEARHVPWAEVDRVSRGNATPAPPPGVVMAGLTLPGLSALPSPVPGELGAPRIHIKSDQPVTLHEATVSFDGRLRPVACRTPCNEVVDGRSGHAFFFAGDEIPESSRFLLSEKSGDVTAQVSPGNSSLRSAGGGLLLVGILGAVAGSVMLPIGLAMNSARASATPVGPAGAMDTHSSPMPLIGGVMLGTGAAVLVTGVVMNVLGTTRFEFRQGSAAPRAVVESGVIRF